MHNTVQHSFAWLFRTLGVSVCLEPLGLFNEIYPDDNRRPITKLVNNSNDQQRCASASIFCEDPFSSSTPYAEELEYNIDFLIEHQDIRQCHFPGDQNRAEDRYEEEAYNPNEEGQHVFQSLSPD